MGTERRYRRYLDEPNMSDKTLLLNVEDLINRSFGTAKESKVNFKLLKTILQILARQMRLLNQEVEIRIDSMEPDEYERSTRKEYDEYISESSSSSASSSSAMSDITEVSESEMSEAEEPEPEPAPEDDTPEKKAERERIREEKAAAKAQEKAERAAIKEKQREEKEREKAQRAIAKEREREAKAAEKERRREERAIAKDLERAERGASKERERAERATSKEREKAEKAAAKEQEKAEKAAAKAQEKAERAGYKERERAERATTKEQQKAEKAAAKEQQKAEKAAAKEQQKAEKAAAKDQQRAEKAGAKGQEATDKGRERGEITGAREQEISGRAESPKERERAERAAAKQREKEDKATAKQREKEDKATAKQREKEEKAIAKERAKAEKAAGKGKWGGDASDSRGRSSERYRDDGKSDTRSTASRGSTVISEASRPGSRGARDKILVVEKGPTTRGTDVPRVGSIEVVTASQFALLEKEVRQLQGVTGPMPMPSMPDSAQLRHDLAKGTASLTDTMHAMQLNARVQAAEEALSRMANLMTQLATVMPSDMRDRVGRLEQELHDAVASGPAMAAKTLLARGGSPAPGARKSVAIDPVTGAYSRPGTGAGAGAGGGAGAGFGVGPGADAGGGYGAGAGIGGGYGAGAGAGAGGGAGYGAGAGTGGGYGAGRGMGAGAGAGAGVGAGAGYGTAGGYGTGAGIGGVPEGAGVGGEKRAATDVASRSSVGRASVVSGISAGASVGLGMALGVTQPEMEDYIQTVKGELLKFINTTTSKAVQHSEMAASTAKAVADRLDIALKLEKRINTLYSQTADYADQLSGFDSGLTTQMASFQEQMAQMRADLKGGLKQLEQANNNAESAALTDLSERYDVLVTELDTMLHAHQALTALQNQISGELRSLVECVEMLREQKADRDEVLDGLKDKADMSRLSGLLHEEQFIEARNDLDRRIELCYDKFRKQDRVWLGAIKDLTTISEGKAEIMTLMAVRDNTTEELRSIQETLRELFILLGEPKAAILTRKLAANGMCGACLVPALMEPVDRAAGKPPQLPRMPAPDLLPEPCLQEIVAQPPPDLREHVCRRWVGGSHTLMMDNVTREKVGTLALQTFPTKRYTGYGVDGKLYMLEEELEPCLECNKLSTDAAGDAPLPGELPTDNLGKDAGEPENIANNHGDNNEKTL